MILLVGSQPLGAIQLYDVSIMYRGGASRGGPGGRGGFNDRGRGMGGGRGGPTKRGGGPPSSNGPSKRPRFDQPSSQPSNGYATQPSKYVFKKLRVHIKEHSNVKDNV